MPKNNIKLPKDVYPTLYDITLKPDLENFTFSGFETIDIVVNKNTKKITLHSKELNIKTAEIKIKKDKIFAQISYNEENETTTFTFPQTIPKGKYKIHLVFEGILNDKMRGFYKSTYLHNGENKHLATTQFEATDARRSFPCFDEPEQKAIFNVSLIVKKGQTAISNTLPHTISEHEAGYDIFRFSPTPKMSTYLLAFIVGDLEYIEDYTKNKVHVKIYTTKGKKEQGRFALSCAIKSLEFYEEYFDIKYPLPTLDMIAIPDFASGAMENWGAITYRESALLVDENNSSLNNKQWVALVIAHELAHQWFGNLVTMRWWTDLWLNEGFASYIEYLAVDKIFPEWNIWLQFLNHDMNVALRLDSLYHTHPIEIEVHHPNEIGEIFDEVSYSKGASVIRMLADYLGEEKFRDGLRYYLKKHSYKNTITEDLWDAFSKVSKKDIVKVMKNWTLKSGYPSLTLKTEKNKVLISQKRFFANKLKEKINKPDRNGKGGEKTIWQIPINYLQGDKKMQLLLNKEKTFIPYNNETLKINLGESSFFRTKYDSILLEKLALKIKNLELNPVDRLGIVRDLFALFENGEIKIDSVLEFLPNYKNEDNYTVWLEILIGLSKIKQIFSDEKFKKFFDDYTMNLLEEILKKVNFEAKSNEDHLYTLLRPLVLNTLGKAGNNQVLKFLIEKWENIKKAEKVDPNLRSAIYQNIANKGSEKEFNELVKRYKEENLHEEKNRIGNALGDFKDEKILVKVIEFAFSENVRSQDTIGILSGVAINPKGRKVWLKMIKKNWKLMLNRYGDGGHSLGRAIKAFSNATSEKDYREFKEFFKKNKTPGAERALEQVLEKIEANMLVYKKESKDLIKFLKKWKP